MERSMQAKDETSAQVAPRGALWKTLGFGEAPLFHLQHIKKWGLYLRLNTACDHLQSPEFS
jgi:hypothetical protein